LVTQVIRVIKNGGHRTKGGEAQKKTEKEKKK
jgi:hypothetical protein